MSIIETLTIGQVHTLTQNVAYGLPVRACYAFVQGSGVQQSNNNSTWTAVTLDANNGFIATGVYVRSTAVDSTIILKAT